MQISLDIVELRKLISGDFTFRPCLECNGKGWNWYCADTGQEIHSPKDDFDNQECCDDCQGIGGFLKIRG